MLSHINSQPIKPTRVVILGAGGFVSGAVERKLLILGIPVLALARKDLDLTNELAASKLVSSLKPDDTLLFVSAKAPVKSEAMLIENLIMAKSVCEAIAKLPPKHLIYISSDAVYSDSDKPLTEDSATRPDSLHGIMHVAREVMLANCFKGSLCIVRPTLIHGNGDPHNGYGPNRFKRLLENGEDISLFGNGEERRDHVWIEDVAEIITLCTLNQSAGILNIATGEVVSFREIAERLVMISGNKNKIISNPRVGKMPHNGYRAFDASATRIAFPAFEYHSLFKVFEDNAK